MFVAEQGFDIPQTQRSQFPTGELAPFRLTSQPTKLLPLAVVGCSPLCSTETLQINVCKVFLCSKALKSSMQILLNLLHFCIQCSTVSES